MIVYKERKSASPCHCRATKNCQGTTTGNNFFSIYFLINYYFGIQMNKDYAFIFFKLQMVNTLRFQIKEYRQRIYESIIEMDIISFLFWSLVKILTTN